MILLDSDVLIWVYRGHAGAARLLYELEDPAISLVTRMELLRGARDATEKRRVKQVLEGIPVRTVALTPEIGATACALLDAIGLGNAIGVVDCLIAATALEHAIPLVSGNVKHYRCVPRLTLEPFHA